MGRRILAALCAACLVLCAFGCRKAPEPVTEPTETILTDPYHNAIPVYSDVDFAALDASLFSLDENGRMTYADEQIQVYNGVDISVFQGEIDWQAVKADGIDFAILRAGFRGYGTDGSLNVDESFARNAAGATAAGIDIGVYFFSQAVTTAEAAEEAAYLLEIIKPYNITYPVAYDWERITQDTARTDETDNETITQCAVTFCDAVAAAGYEPVIYFNRSQGYFNYDLSAVKDYHFWLAEYNETPAFVYNYRIWQYDNEGRVDGIDCDVDLNLSLIDFSKTKSVG